MLRRPFSRVFIISCLVLLLLVSCKKYNLDFVPPNEKTKLDSIFPSRIGDKDRSSLMQETFRGEKSYLSIYGNKEILIRLIVLRSKVEADGFFTSHLISDIEGMKSPERAKRKGKWYASGEEISGRIHFRWVNDKYIFTIEASNQAAFNQAIDACPYISR